MNVKALELKPILLREIDNLHVEEVRNECIINQYNRVTHLGTSQTILSIFP